VGRRRRCTRKNCPFYFTAAQTDVVRSRCQRIGKVKKLANFHKWLMAERDAWVQSGGRAKRKAAETATGDESDEQSDEESSDGADTDEGQGGDGEEEEKDKSKKKRAV
jgi:hypothetical protein